MFDFFLVFGTSLLVVQVVMSIFWILYLYWKNVSLVDIGWGVSFISVAFVNLILGREGGYLPRKILIFLLILAWAGRLAFYLTKRFDVQKNDPRYTKLLENAPFSWCPPLQILIHYALQGLIVAVLSIPFIFINQNTAPYFSAWEVYGVIVWVIGFWGESSSDKQLHLFKTDPSNQGQVCDWGLWKYSRHPNYFFESVIWVGYAMISFAAPWGWLGVLSPLLITYLLLRVSGIPLNEQQAIETKGESYKKYQKETSPFIPWFSFKKT